MRVVGSESITNNEFGRYGRRVATKDGFAKSLLLHKSSSCLSKTWRGLEGPTINEYFHLREYSANMNMDEETSPSLSVQHY